MNQGNDQTLAHQAADVVDNVADNVRATAHTVGRTIQDASQNVRRTASRAAAAVGESYDEAGHIARNSMNHSLARARSWENSFEGCVRDNPKSSVLIAGAIGALIAICWTRR